MASDMRHTLVSSRAMTQWRASPKALAMSASTDANPCGGMKKIKVVGVPTVLLKGQVVLL